MDIVPLPLLLCLHLVPSLFLESLALTPSLALLLLTVRLEVLARLSRLELASSALLDTISSLIPLPLLELALKTSPKAATLASKPSHPNALLDLLAAVLLANVKVSRLCALMSFALLLRRLLPDNPKRRKPSTLSIFYLLAVMTLKSLSSNPTLKPKSGTTTPLGLEPPPSPSSVPPTRREVPLPSKPTPLSPELEPRAKPKLSPRTCKTLP